MIKNKKINKNIVNWSIVVISLLVISLVLPALSSLTVLESFRIVFGSIYVLFLPGYILTYLFFPNTKPFDSEKDEKGAIDALERFALSFALSIAVVPLIVFYLNLVGVKISTLNTSLIILGIIVISLSVLKWKNKKN